MFYFNGNSDELEKLVKEYICTPDEKVAGGFGYEIGKGWPNFTLDDLEKTEGLDGREYGFNPDRMVASIDDKPAVKATMPNLGAINYGGSPKVLSWGYDAAGFDEQFAPPIEKSLEIDTGFDFRLKLSSEITRLVQPAVDEALKEFLSKNGSVQLDSMDREFFEGLVDKAINKASYGVSEVSDIILNNKMGLWNRYKLLRCVFENVILKELLLISKD